MQEMLTALSFSETYPRKLDQIYFYQRKFDCVNWPFINTVVTTKMRQGKSHLLKAALDAVSKVPG